MKKVIALLLAVGLSMAIIAGCSEKQKEDVTIRVAGLKGPTSMGMVGLMDASDKGTSKNKYEFSIHGTADEVTPKLINGELDVAAIPANLASVLFNNTEGKIQVLAVNTLGVNYIVDMGDDVNTFADLKGKTIFASGKGSSPEYALRYLLTQNGIDPDNDATIEFKSEASEVVALMAENQSGIAMLPQPYVFVAKATLPELRVAIDMNQEWANLDNGSLMITGVVVARADFVKENPDAVKAFLEEYKSSTEYVNANPADAAVLIEKYDIFKAAIAEKAIPFCNITYIAGGEMKAAMEGYLNVLYNENPKAVGGKLPESGFYYGA